LPARSCFPSFAYGSPAAPQEDGNVGQTAEQPTIALADNGVADPTARLAIALPWLAQLLKSQAKPLRVGFYFCTPQHVFP
jgi:hypothetical protein